MTKRTTTLRMRLPGRSVLSTRFQQHVQEVLDRGTGWELRGQHLVLEARAGDVAHVIVHNPVTDTWGRTHLVPGASIDLPPEDLSRRAWVLGYFSAAAAADDVEEVVRLSALTAAALT